jgi:hypothetical protein
VVNVDIVFALSWLFLIYAFVLFYFFFFVVLIRLSNCNWVFKMRYVLMDSGVSVLSNSYQRNKFITN